MYFLFSLIVDTSTGNLLPGFPLINYLRYDYKLISGNVTKVRYNEGRADQFYHLYSYDADNRRVDVSTSRDSVLWDSDARYSYYAHGPLRRTELGEDKLQGVDYTYTIQGQLKAINNPSLVRAEDPGEDGLPGGIPGRARYAADSFAVSLGYFKGDFARQGSDLDSSVSTQLQGSPLYDGNISSVSNHIGYTANSDTTPMKYE